MGLIDYLQLPQVQHGLIASTLVAVVAGLLGPFVVTRRAAFAVHGVAELSLTGAAAGLLIAGDAVLGALVGSLVVAAAMSAFGVRESQRDSAIGVTLAFGLGVGVFLLGRLHNAAASAALNILFGQILGVSNGQLVLLLVLGGGVLLTMLVIYRPLLFASVDPDVAEARGVPVRAVGLIFMFALAITVTEAAQVVGTLLVLSLAITPAAAAHRISARPLVVTALSIGLALLAADGGVLLSLIWNVRPSVLITAISFASYIVARLVGGRVGASDRSPRAYAEPVPSRPEPR